MATVTKKDIVVRLSNKLGMTQVQTANMVESMIEIMGSAIADGDEIALRTFGTFEICVAKGKIGRNPNQPDVPVQIPDRYVVRFRPGQELRDKLASLPLDSMVK